MMILEDNSYKNFTDLGCGPLSIAEQNYTLISLKLVIQHRIKSFLSSSDPLPSFQIPWDQSNPLPFFPFNSFLLRISDHKPFFEPVSESPAAKLR